MSTCKSMRHVLVGGEALPPALATRFQQRLPHAHLHNVYGPTETTVDATGGSADDMQAAWARSIITDITTPVTVCRL